MDSVIKFIRLIWFKVGMMWTLHLELDIINLDGMWCTVETCWCYELDIHFMLSYYIQGREPYLSDFVKKNNKTNKTRNLTNKNPHPSSLNFGLDSAIGFVKLGMMIGTAKLYILISV